MVQSRSMRPFHSCRSSRDFWSRPISFDWRFPTTPTHPTSPTIAFARTASCRSLIHAAHARAVSARIRVIFSGSCAPTRATRGSRHRRGINARLVAFAALHLVSIPAEIQYLPAHHGEHRRRFRSVIRGRQRYRPFYLELRGTMLIILSDTQRVGCQTRESSDLIWQPPGHLLTHLGAAVPSWHAG